MADRTRGSSSLTAVWARAVFEPASRRALGVWLGASIVAAVVFGGTGMQPEDLTELALHNPGVGAVLLVTWLLVFVPVARVLVRQDEARFLRSLPSSPAVPLALGGIGLVWWQLPWVALWLAGEGARGALVVFSTTVLVAVIASWRPPVVRAKVPRWSSAGGALFGVYLRALRRQGGDALVRGVGLAVLAGLAGGLFVANNQLTGAHSAVVGASVIAVALVPAVGGALVALGAAHRQAAVLAMSLGISPSVRVRVLAQASIAIYFAASAIASLSAIAFVGSDGLAIAAAAPAVGVSCGIAATRVLLYAEAYPQATTGRTIIGAVVVAAGALIYLGVLGVLGIPALAATATVSVLTRKS